MQAKTKEEQIEVIRESLTNQSPSASAILDIEDLREDAKLLAEVIVRVCPDSREKSLAITKLEESVMWAVKAIVLPRDAG